MNLTDEARDHSLDITRYCSDCGQRLVRGHHCEEEDARLDRMEAAIEYDARMRDETRQWRTVDGPDDMDDMGRAPSVPTYIRQWEDDAMAGLDD